MASGRNERERERWETDEEFREEKKRQHREYYLKHKEKLKANSRERQVELAKELDKRCIVCGVLLNFRSKLNLCREHYYLRGKTVKEIKDLINREAPCSEGCPSQKAKI